MSEERKTKVYLGIPYGGMQESSFKQANLISNMLLHRGYNVFSPISHGHPITQVEGETPIPGDWDYWKSLLIPFLDWADELFVVIPEEGGDRVEKSVGLQAEIAYAAGQLMPISYVSVIWQNNKPIIHIQNF